MSSAPPQPVAPLVEHFFRHEAGRLVSVLTRIFDWRHFDLVEDMVQRLRRSLSHFTGKLQPGH